MFAVESLDETVARRGANGSELIGEVVQYEELAKCGDFIQDRSKLRALTGT